MTSSTGTRGLLLGRDRTVTYRWLGAGTALFALIVLGILLFHAWEPNGRIAARGGRRAAYAMFWGGIVALSLAAAAASAYRNDGWAVSAALVFVPATVLAVHPVADAFLRLPEVRGFRLLVPEPPALFVWALAAGTLAFVAGRGVRRLLATPDPG